MTLFPELERQLGQAAARRNDTAPAPTRPRHGARRRKLIPLAALSCASLLAIVLVLLPGSRDTPSLAARAYAATSGPGILHWRTDVVGYANGKADSRQRIEGWSLGTTSHVLHSDVINSKEKLSIDERTVGRKSRAWMSGTDEYFELTPRARQTAIEMIPVGDPFLAFRRAYRAGRLRDLGQGRFDVRFRHIPAGGVVYEVDQRTGRPNRLVLQSDQPAHRGRPATRSRTVLRFSVYERLPVTPTTRGKLKLLPHPGAGPGSESALKHFAALRSGAAPSGELGRRLRGLAQNLGPGTGRSRVDADAIRELVPNVFLMPAERNHVCLALADQAGIGATCVTVRKALKSGISLGDPAGATVVVPDGVASIKARRHYRGRFKSYPVVNSVARLPGLSYEVRLPH